jgi:hypothetical protein
MEIVDQAGLATRNALYQKGGGVVRRDAFKRAPWLRVARRAVARRWFPIVIPVGINYSCVTAPGHGGSGRAVSRRGGPMQAGASRSCWSKATEIDFVAKRSICCIILEYDQEGAALPVAKIPFCCKVIDQVDQLC